MGYACAAAAVKRGHKVTLVSGSVSLAVPEGVKVIKVVSSDDMAQAVQGCFAECDCVIMAAAVGDYKPQRQRKNKLQKSGAGLTLKLRGTIDILAGLGRAKANQILIGFAVQDKAARQRARQKMKAKNLDAIVLNSPAAFGAIRTDVQILERGGKWQCLSQVSKIRIADKIIRLAEKISRQ